jgi:predicted nuclease with TOPRIM domain
MSMSAKELHEELMDEPHDERDTEKVQLILRALSLLAAVEDGDEIVRYLNKDAARLLAKSKQVPSTAGQMKYEEISRKQANAAARITQDAQEIAALKGELASVKAHAEAMADRYREFNECAADDTEMSLQRLHDAVDAYRAHKEGA